MFCTHLETTSKIHQYQPVSPESRRSEGPVIATGVPVPSPAPPFPLPLVVASWDLPGPTGHLFTAAPGTTLYIAWQARLSG
jgi:hypothetical protein